VDAPIYHELDRSLSQSYAWIFTRNGLITESGIENLRVDIQTTGPTDEQHPWIGIQFIGVEDCWAKDVTVLHFGKSGFALGGATRCTILNCSAIEPHSVVEPPERYNFNLNSACNNILFQGCHASEARHAFVSNGTSSVAGLVFTNCSSVDEYTASEGHRRWGEAFLWDNTSFSSRNTNRVLGLYNRGSYGTGHGWTGTNLVAWNISAPINQIVVQKPPIGQNYGIGCDAAVSNNGPFPHPAGWIEGTGETMAIESLYEAQLLERLTYGVGPDTPAKLRSTDYSSTAPKYVVLEWTDIALDESLYVLERSSDGGASFEIEAFLGENSQSFSDTNILQDSYHYRVRAVNDIGASAYSNLLRVDLLVATQTPTPTNTATPTLTASPTNTPTNTPVPPMEGPPVLGAVSDTGGVLMINWTHNFSAPTQFLGFAYDIYMGQFIGGGLDDSIFHPFLSSSRSGAISLFFSGAYHAWILAQYPGSISFLRENPWTGIAYSGDAHLPRGVGVEVMEISGRGVRLTWAPEIFGTWHYQIVAFHVTDLGAFAGEFVQTEGPLGTSLFHFVDFGEVVFLPGTADFFAGTADFTLPMDGDYVFFIRGVPWLDPLTPGEYGVSPVFSIGAPE